jgi:hypothetical protein
VPITPIVWNGRLFLFWLKVVKQAAPATVDTNKLPQGSVASFNARELQQYASADRSATDSVSVSAVLCWTEYYNGYWQPSKTSDINLPTYLGRYDDPGGPNPFEQSHGLLRLVPAQFTGTSPWLAYAGQFSAPSDALLLAVWPTLGGYVLHNK